MSSEPRYYLLITRYNWGKEEDGKVSLCRTDKHPVFDGSFYLTSIDTAELQQQARRIGKKTVFRQRAEAVFADHLSRGMLPKVDFFDVDLKALPFVYRTLWGQHFQFDLAPKLRKSSRPGWKIKHHMKDLERLHELVR